MSLVCLSEKAAFLFISQIFSWETPTSLLCVVYGPGCAALLCRSIACQFPSTFIANAASFDFGLYFTIRRSNHSVTLFILLYLPPLSSNYSIPTSDVVSFISKAVSSTLTNYPVELFATEIILLGDFSLPFTDWTKMCSTSKREMALLEIFTSMGLFALITDEPTHYQGHTVDNILINNESPKLSHCILDQHTALSGHFPIKITLYVNQIVSTNTNKVIYSFNNAADIQSFANSWETFPSHVDSASEIVDAFYSYIQLSIPLCFPKKTIKAYPTAILLQLTLDALLEQNEYTRLYLLQNPRANNLAKLKRAREDFVQSFEMDKILFIQGSSTTSLTDCFSLLRKLKRSSHPTIMYLNNSTLQTEIDIANGFNSFFAENFNSTSFSYLPSNSDSSIRLADLNHSFHPNTLLELLTKVKPSSNQTFDQIPTALLLWCPCLFAELLYLIFHRIIESGNFPNIWKVAIVMPLHKKGSTNFIKNYRPISLLPKVSLILERILFTFLYCKTSSKLHPKQLGFQAKKSAIIQLVDFLECVHSQKCCDISYSIHLDYEKAFDKVPHNVLLSKLEKIGLDKDFIKFFQSYLYNRSQVVNIAGHLSNALPVPSRVPQGSVLAPLLFLILINDLPSIFQDCIPWAFADDLKLLFSSLNFAADLTRLNNWNIANAMLVNASKSKCLYYHGKQKLLLSISDEPIECVALHQDLGLHINNYLRWNSHTSLKILKARRSFFLLKSNIPWNTPSKVKINLLRSMVFSIMLYGIPAFLPNLTQLKELENFQKHCLKWALGSSLPYEDSLKKYAILPVCYFIELHIFTLFAKMKNESVKYDVEAIVSTKPATSLRQCSINPLYCKTHSKAHESSFFPRAVAMSNYLLRHRIINGFFDNDINSVKHYLLEKRFDMNLSCSFFINCACTIFCESRSIS